MYVKRVFYDDRLDFDNMLKELDEPGWIEIRDIVRRLEGKFTTQIIMDNNNEDDYLCVRRAGDNGYTLTVYESDEDVIYTLMNPETQNEEVRPSYFGEVQSDPRVIVPMSMVIKVVESYFQKGIRSREYSWKK